MPKLLIYKQGTNELIKEVTSYRDCYKYQLDYLRMNGIDTYIKRQKKNKSDIKSLDEKCEELWKKITKHNANYKCEYCKKESGKLDSHHIMSRKQLNTRWDSSNCCVLCSEHHRFGNKGFSAHTTPDYFKDWIIKVKGEDFYNKLLMKSAMRITNKKELLQLNLFYLQKEHKNIGL